MYHEKILFGFDLYDIFMLIGLLSAIVVYDRYVSKRNVPAKIHNFYLILGVASILIGLLSANFVQAVFNWIKTGVFKMQGLTFYGGVIGGVATFIVGLYAVGGMIFKNKEHLTYFTNVYEVAPCCITIAHGFGRIGCLFAGCCYGKEVHGFPGLHMDAQTADGYVAGYYLPTQLYEAIFLFALFAVLTYFYKKDRKINFIVYLIAYGVWRFSIEFLRADERGAFLPFMTPAQAISVIAVAVGIGMIIFRMIKKKKTGVSPV